ncbi:MAG: TonB family protein [Deltaproteobacteria bacterium]|nr:TonB family protein [Deltaproteobacteria bacterium]
MLVLSILFHALLLSLIFFLPEPMSKTSRFEGMVYEVDLVELPSGELPRVKTPRITRKEEAKAIVGKKPKAKRIVRTKKRKPVVIAKKTINKKKILPEKPKADPSKLLDQVISKIERKVQRQERDLGRNQDVAPGEEEILERALSRIEKKAMEGSKQGGSRAGGFYGVSADIYKAEIDNRIKSNWSYPVAIPGSRGLEAVIVVKVRRDGKIMEMQFAKRSSNAIFDQSVAKAVERSDPLPPFPEGYLKSYEEIQIRFNLKDLENY